MFINLNSNCVVIPVQVFEIKTYQQLRKKLHHYFDSTDIVIKQAGNGPQFAWSIWSTEMGWNEYITESFILLQTSCASSASLNHLHHHRLETVGEGPAWCPTTTEKITTCHLVNSEDFCFKIFCILWDFSWRRMRHLLSRNKTIRFILPTLYYLSSQYLIYAKLIYRCTSTSRWTESTRRHRFST